MRLTEVEVGKDQEFTVNTQGAGGLGNVGVMMTSPSGRPIPCKLESDKANGIHGVKYIPPEEGSYKVDVSYDSNPVLGSPFGLEGVMPADPSKVIIHSSSTVHQYSECHDRKGKLGHIICSFKMQKIFSETKSHSKFFKGQ